MKYLIVSLMLIATPAFAHPPCFVVKGAVSTFGAAKAEAFAKKHYSKKEITQVKKDCHL